jgi:hypothetical protein
MAFKLIYLAKRNPKIEPQDFPEAWRSHSRLASTLVNTMGKHFLRVRQCIKAYEARVPPAYVNEHDGAAILTLRSWDSLIRARHHPDAISIMHDDEPRVFAGYVKPWTMAAEEERLIEKREGSFALLHFFARRPNVGIYDFQDRWSGEYADSIQALDTVAESAGVFALNHVLDHPSPDYTFHGISELWFDDMDEALAMARDPRHQAIVSRMHEVADPERLVSLLIRLNFEKRKTDATAGWTEAAPAQK